MMLMTLQGVFAWDPLGLAAAGKKIVDRLIDDITYELVPAVQKAIREEVDHIFDDELPVFLEEVQEACIDIEDHARDDAEQVIDFALKGLENFFRDMLNHVQTILDHTIAEITQAMDDFVDIHLTGLIDHTFDHINDVLTRVEKDVQQLVCEEEGVIKQLELFIGDSLGSLDCGCALQVKTEWAQPCACTCSDILPAKVTCHCNPGQWATLQDQLAFQYIECSQRRAIESGQLPVGHIIELLAGVRSLAEQLRCYHAGSDGTGAIITEKYTHKILNFSKEIFIWRNASSYALDDAAFV